MAVVALFPGPHLGLFSPQATEHARLPGGLMDHDALIIHRARGWITAVHMQLPCFMYGSTRICAFVNVMVFSLNK